MTTTEAGVSYQQKNEKSYLYGSNAPYIEEMYEAYLVNPGSVSEHWRAYFDALQNAPTPSGERKRDVAHMPVVQAFAQRARQGVVAAAAGNPELERKHTAVQQLIAAYRVAGVRWSDLDPLRRMPRPLIPELEPSHYGLTDADMELRFDVSNTYFGKDSMTLRDVMRSLRQTYCSTVGAEFMHTTNLAEKRWWQERLESTLSTPDFDAEGKKKILKDLTAAEGLERYLHTKYVGQKRFSLEGGESFIPAMHDIIQTAGAGNVQEVVIGMAHRGRLNVLVNIMGKTPKELFAEFEHTGPEELPAGDVKYHQGFSNDVNTPGGVVHLTLAFNPSHLEIVNPVVLGSCRSRMDRRGDREGDSVLPVLVHGDAAFAGQGVVMESLAMSQTRAYYCGGALHIVINNQIGFTTSDPRDTRSSPYCSDAVKMIDAPVLHVNADNPEAVVMAARLAFAYRQAFNKDVVLDIVCYRKLGHNEQDTPALTQPLMYKKVGKHPGTRKLYADRLEAQGLGENLGKQFIDSYRDALDEGRHLEDISASSATSRYIVDWSRYLNRKWTDASATRISLAEWKRLAQRVIAIPEDVKPHALLKRVYAARAEMGSGAANVDWGMAEVMAYATLVEAGHGVRITGEDCGRGTFAHRHAVVHDQDRVRYEDGSYVPLQYISKDQAPFEVYDSLLSEEAVLAFEYGYASNDPASLVIWEAQFGDFANGAQVVIDQFIASGEVKWGRLSGLTMLLPHGYEGQGPEHSSARIERFMQLAADTNMQIVQPTTASQIFHLLRRQVLRPLRKPLVVFTPKSLLRHKSATSPIEEFTKGSFQTIIPDEGDLDAASVKRVIVCSGKVYYDLVEKREAKKHDDVAIIRVEQLYPFPHKAFSAELEKYPNARELVWCQDEPQNQGAWFYVQHYIYENMQPGQKLGYAGRAPSASPAVGYAHLHIKQQKALVTAAFAKLKGFVLHK